MLPDKKARDLVDKMYNTEHCGIEHFPNKHYCDCSEINLYQAKQCALIAVDEILKIGSVIVDYNTRDYWQEVKKLIEKL